LRRFVPRHTTFRATGYVVSTRHVTTMARNGFARNDIHSAQGEALKSRKHSHYPDSLCLHGSLCVLCRSKKVIITFFKYNLSSDKNLIPHSILHQSSKKGNLFICCLQYRLLIWRKHTHTRTHTHTHTHTHAHTHTGYQSISK
jgi:hypothetical protein